MTQEKRPAWVKWIVLGCAGLVVMVALAVWGFVALIMGSLKQSDAYKEALAAVRADSAAVEALGEPAQFCEFLGLCAGVEDDVDVHSSGVAPVGAPTIPIAGSRSPGTDP